MSKRIILWLFETAYIFGIGYLVYKGMYGKLGLVGVCMGVTGGLYLLSAMKDELISSKMHGVLCGFIFTTVFLGSIFRLYDIVPYYDDFLHVGSGAVFACLGFNIGKFLWADNRVTKRGKLLLLMFSFTFVTCSAVLWEMFEFASDVWLNTNMQAGGLSDTCIDMSDALAGCILVLPVIKKKIDKIHTY